MSEQNATLDVFYENWKRYQDLLKDALGPLTPEQLALSAADNERTVGKIAAHMIAVRVRWFSEDMGEVDKALTQIAIWDKPDAPARTAAELVKGLDLTWQMMAEALAHWNSDDMAQTITDEDDGKTVYLSRSWVIWHLIEHDLHHGGEISLTLGMHGRQAIAI